MLWQFQLGILLIISGEMESIFYVMYRCNDNELLLITAWQAAPACGSLALRVSKVTLTWVASMTL